MKKIICSIVLCSLVSGCSISIFGPPKVEEYKGTDYAILRANESGSLQILRTYELQNGCYKRIKTETLVAATFLKPDTIRDTNYKIKAMAHYVIAYHYNTNQFGRTIEHVDLYSFVPVAGHTYGEGTKDITTNTAAKGWPLDQRCRGLD